MEKSLIIILSLLFLISCYDPSSIKVQNKLPKTTLRNVEWGGIPLASQIITGETSTKIEIDAKNNYYDIDLPEEHPLKFYIEVNGDLVYLETKEAIRLEIEDNLTIEINDSTPVINPLLENQ
ncbi:MAG TPA: hypothetical protein DCQ26_12170 [Marinilabiliales bacterium]|jgi:hypothetical protein|nr:MAG: hypothetical protein A2W95_19160 [Bacteroidetes bacterium GWA2_40_14]OFX60329.1 MAG: hypothetical protein A2W84_07995 [Bacteroidetes bacterium GWC2_40_13]OFX76089.1 MAG: hypothetical protein A2W96_01420 [Bacteroidetes bacterium GWD2_40_43]OFX94297.1 MAG: hypothetical protein A2W97_19200 [Bacteroidetes bacterium GWE2_40_63]OFY18776.1 MAG: hypothetical protein A2W88_05965 [Bacteroidetes bacterium GWF2_40_13]OFZ24750.1 MAG: hypothetical protein A2437_15530 [Bacteroidetes bacterium RIFOXYC